MKFYPDSYAKCDHYTGQLHDEVLRRIRFEVPLTKEQQVLEVGCGTGRSARRFLLPHCQPCRRIVATDLQPDMIEFAREHFSHENIVHDVLDITTPDLAPFLETYGKFDRVFSFLVFHMIQDPRAAYANIAKLLNDGGECLVLAFSSLDFADVWAEVCGVPKWKGRIPDPRDVANASFNFNCVKSAAKIEAEVRDTLRGTGLQCISCEVRDSSWKFDSMDHFLDLFLNIAPFKATIPEEEWAEFSNLWAELMHRKSSTSPGEPIVMKFGFYVVHGRRFSG
ncbi:juvenile hormone acid O-methyltransferase isoform X1 [Dermacentor silvarum]|uniref:juvenile hormone acid O-methyltransferase isoform X1 n=1 Tax=Dermacentor silvarum TaxID=543639 RepID=UPI002100C324|nr:juvenile hormone acid O-methyltransferase isoform X1 [Dermacentor silvarum]